MITCPSCQEKITVHADGTASCSCEFVNANGRFPKSWKNGDVDLDLLRSKMKREIKGDTTQKRRQSKRMEKLNKMAQDKGWSGISEYLTAVINAEVFLPSKRA